MNRMNQFRRWSETTLWSKNWRKKSVVRDWPDGVGAAGASEGEVDAGEEGELAAVVVGFEGGEGAVLILALHVEHAVGGANDTQRWRWQWQKQPQTRGDEESSAASAKHLHRRRGHTIVWWRLEKCCWSREVGVHARSTRMENHIGGGYKIITIIIYQ